MKRPIKKAKSIAAKPLRNIMQGVAREENEPLKILMKQNYSELESRLDALSNEIKNLKDELGDFEKTAKYIYYYHGGSGNHGCEALVRTISDICKIPKTSIGLYSYNPEQDRQFGLLDYTLFIKKSNLNTDEIPISLPPGTTAISIGGDNYCGYPIPQLAKYNQKFHIRGAKTALIGCSIEPNNLEHGEVVGDLCQFDLITARESITYNALLAKGVTKNTHLIPDSAFTMKTQKSGITLPKNTVGLNISDIAAFGGKTMFHTNIINLIRYILEETTYNIALIPHVHQNGNDDYAELRKLAEYFNRNPRIILIDSNFTAPELKDIISQCIMLIAARTHCSIAGYSTYVPTLVLSYSVKSKGIAQDIFDQYEHYIKSIYNLTDEAELKNAFIWLDKNKLAIKKHLQEFMPSYIKKASKLKQYIDNIQDTKVPTVPKAHLPKPNTYKKGTLSIITSCYNSEEYLARYLNSILNQTDHHIELIIVNDGSTDRTERIVSDYAPILANQNINLVYLKQQNAGIGAAYNLALPYISGEYFCWCDSDNFYSPDFVKTALNFFKSNPSAKILRHDGYFVPEKDSEDVNIFQRTDFEKFSINSSKPYEKHLFMNAILEKNWHFGNIILNTEAFDESSQRKIYPSRQGQNWQLCLPLLNKYEAFYIPEPLFYFVIRDQSVSNQNVHHGDNSLLFKQLDEYKKILLETIKNIPGLNQEELTTIIEQKYICLKLTFSKNSNDKPNIEKYQKLFNEKVSPNNLYKASLSKLDS